MERAQPKARQITVSSVFAKLNLKEQREILVVHAPASFEIALASLRGVTVLRDPAVVKTVRFAVAFVYKQSDLDSLSAMLAAKTVGDALLWFAYPKGTSRQYRCEFNRDSGWNVMCAAGFRAVRLIAIDTDWSALRFRRVEYGKPSERGIPSHSAARQRTRQSRS
jgi:hypothetical protein